MKIIGLTGNIACGKSVVADMLKGLGASAIDADRIARCVVEPEKPGWKDIVAEFGRGILNPDGAIDRKKLGEIIFNNEAKRKALNSIIHPKIKEGILINLKKHENAKPSVVIIEAALIIENEGWLNTLVNGLIVVISDDEVQLKRLMERSGFSKEEALARVSSQMPTSQKVARADYVIDNSGSLDETMRQVKSIWGKISV